MFVCVENLCEICVCLFMCVYDVLVCFYDVVCCCGVVMGCDVNVVWWCGCEKFLCCCLCGVF